MIFPESLFDEDPYGLAKNEKEALIINCFNQLVKQHTAACDYYKKLLCSLDFHKKSFERIEELPFIPVRLFKIFSLKSVKDSDVVKTLASSGTTSQTVSRIFIDKITAHLQMKALSTIIKSYIGKKRAPMLIIDSKNVIKDPRLISARGGGILGLSPFGRDHCYALDENMDLDMNGLRAFLSKYAGESIFIFGFTFMIWKHFYKPLEAIGDRVDLSHATLIHSGGWKKLMQEAITNQTFKDRLHKRFSISRIFNFYGMVEQMGSIFMECEEGFLHCSNFSDIIIRDVLDWSTVAIGTPGVIEVLSILPYSYPGHVLLTEDIGVVHGEDTCKCGRMGKYFEIIGRVPQAEIRGCSDTYAYDS